MDMKYVVHGVSNVPYRTVVKHEGADIKAVIDCLEVSMTSLRHRSLVLRFIGADADAARKQFTEGSAQIVSVTAAK